MKDQVRTRMEISSASIKEAEDLLKRMTLKEKVWLLNGNWNMIRNYIFHRNFYNPTPIRTNGVRRLGFPAVKFSDGPRGVVMGNATCFPVSMARGATFDTELEEEVGDVIGKEVRALGANFFGGVCINLLRHPAWGRAQETYGEDSFLLGEMGAALCRGVQNHNVIACVKHYALNSIENSRFFVDVEIDKRSLHEVYLPHFKKVIDAGAAAVMGAYNRVNGDQACESHYLLTDVLRSQWGFEGFVISDFLHGIRDTKKAIEAGLDIEMPMPIHYQKELLGAVEEESVLESMVDQAALRVLSTQITFQKREDPIRYSRKLVACSDHRELARKVAEKSMVLIKNEDDVLPLKRNLIRRVLVLGRLADQQNTGDHGSSRVYPPETITVLQGLKDYLGKDVEIIHCREDELEKAQMLAGNVDCVLVISGYDFNDEGEFVNPDDINQSLQPLVHGYKNMGQPLIAGLIKRAGKRMEAEFRTKDGKTIGGDRNSLSLPPQQIALINAVSGMNANTIVALVTGSMIMIESWADRVPAILYSWYSGMKGGIALARVLFGEVNPGGKLPFSIPQKEEDLPFFSNQVEKIQYDLFHGYTLLDQLEKKPAYPFGFGLSYSTFHLSELDVVVNRDVMTVKVMVENQGSFDGDEVVQVYIGKIKSSIQRQRKLLKGFSRIGLKAGEKKCVEIQVATTELNYFDPVEEQWKLEPGVYCVWVGNCSDEARLLTQLIELTKEDQTES